MFINRWSGTLLGCLLSQLCLADTLQIDPRAESLYQQAVPYLKQAQDKLDVIPATPPTASAEVRARAEALSIEAGAFLKPAIKLLDQAVALDHPVAQYRLGLIYAIIYPLDAVQANACPLFERSVAQGFAPAALLIPSYCWAFSDTPQFQAALQGMQASMPFYEKYFPQPAVKLECRQEQPVGLTMQWGTSREYQAEIFLIQGDINRPLRTAFYQKAVEINDCYKAKKRLGIFRQP